MTYNIKIGSRTVLYSSFNYIFVLNGISNFEIVLDSATPELRSNASTGSIVEVYRNGSLDFIGEISSRKSMQGGGLSLQGHGVEIELAETPCPTASGVNSKVYNLSTQNTIISDLLSSTGWSFVDKGTSSSFDFRTDGSMSVWNAIMKLINQTQQDVKVLQSAKTIELYDKKGSSNVFELVEGKNISEPVERVKKPKAQKVIVVGKGDGANQYRATAGSGTPVQRIVDSNIYSVSQAQSRADAELNRIKQDIKYYDFLSYNPYLDVVVGDSGFMTAPSAGLNRTSVDVVKVKRAVTSNDVENLVLQTTNPELRMAEKNLADEMADVKNNRNEDNSYMQGSGNTASWGSGINAKSNAPLRVGFYVSSEFKSIDNTFSIQSIVLDYDIDPYRRSVGTANYVGGDAPVSDLSGGDSPGVNGDTGSDDPNISSGSTTVQDRDAEGDSTPQYTQIGGGDTRNTMYLSYLSNSSYAAGDTEVSYFSFYFAVDGSFGNAGSGYDITISNNSTNDAYATITGVCDYATVYNITFPVLGDIEGDTIEVDITDNSGTSRDYTFGLAVSQLAIHGHGPNTLQSELHSHTDNTLYTVNHEHPDGTYNVAAVELDDISISDDTSDNASLNATQLSTIELQYYDEGTSGWVSKYSISNTGVTMDKNVDISDGGTYPDAVGWWRVLLYTDSTSPDYVQGIVRIKHSLDN